MIAAIIIIVLAALCLTLAAHNRQIMRQNKTLMALADEQDDLIQEQDELIGLLWEDIERRRAAAARDERILMDAASIVTWMDTGKVPEKEWWE